MNATEMWERYCEKSGVHADYEAWAFGGAPDELAELFVAYFGFVQVVKQRQAEEHFAHLCQKFRIVRRTFLAYIILQRKYQVICYKHLY